LESVNQFEINQLVLASGQLQHSHNTNSISAYRLTTEWENIKNGISIFQTPTSSRDNSTQSIRFFRTTPSKILPSSNNNHKEAAGIEIQTTTTTVERENYKMSKTAVSEGMDAFLS